ncbi:MAG: threonine-phosphate decarboxylase [Roseobacter sp.]
MAYVNPASLPRPRDHGGGLDLARSRYGGERIAWMDLSTGINPHPYPIASLPDGCWNTLPDEDAQNALIDAARTFWSVPDSMEILAAPGASVLIAALPSLEREGDVIIPPPTYNEHMAAFVAQGWTVQSTDSACARVVVHPNNPDGRLWSGPDLPAPDAKLTIIDESFCDTCPTRSLVPDAGKNGWLVLKSFGKFWGLAGVRLGFLIGSPARIARVRDRLGPWPVSGPALAIGTQALVDTTWAMETRTRLAEDSARLDARMQLAGARVVGGTPLFRLYDVEDAQVWQDRLARHHIWTRTFPYNPRWLRLGIPHALHWPRLEAALA